MEVLLTMRISQKLAVEWGIAFLKIRVHMNAMPRSTMNTNGGTEN